MGRSTLWTLPPAVTANLDRGVYLRQEVAASCVVLPLGGKVEGEATWNGGRKSLYRCRRGVCDVRRNVLRVWRVG